MFIWLMTWWPHTIIHGLNPFFSQAVFAPGGANLAWAFMDPLAMLLVLPLTLAAGPIAAHNAVMLLAPALDGWAAFVLCRYLARSYWPAWLGGYILLFFAIHTLAGCQGALSSSSWSFRFPLSGGSYCVAWPARSAHDVWSYGWWCC